MMRPDIGVHMSLSDLFAFLDSGLPIKLMSDCVEQKVSGR